MCYSNPEVREIMVNALVQYCLDNPRVDYLHVWLSDSTNGMCECENCRDKLPADLYVQLLNELDARLTAQNIPTKIVFLCYCDLCWAPVKDRLKNNDRFVFMATIAHSYSKPLTRFDREPNVVPFKLNRNKVPKPIMCFAIGNWKQTSEKDSGAGGSGKNLCPVGPARPPRQAQRPTGVCPFSVRGQ